MGFQTLSLLPNHTTKLGYPRNLDGGQKMQQVTSQSFRATSPNNVEYGSNAREGSSGGPWVMNYGIQGKGGLTSNLNAIVGVTSYAYTETAIHLLGSSIPDSRAGGFIPLLNSMLPVGPATAEPLQIAVAGATLAPATFASECLFPRTPQIE